METPKYRGTNIPLIHYSKRGRPKGSATNTPDAKSHAMLQGLLAGKAPQQAAIEAGYGYRYARCMAVKMARSLKMKQTMLEYAKGIKPGELGDIAKVLVQANLTSRKAARNAREQLGYIRTALELDGQLGGPSELHLHQHTALPPRVQKMLEDKMVEILEARKEQTYVDAINAADPERAESANQSGKDDGGIQSGESAHGLENGPAGEEAQPGNSDCT